jgi:predicted Zn finger-like uncharacterized protein
MEPMRFECDSCHAKYKISDEKVRGRVVRFPCRKCEHKILIDGREADPDVTVPAGPAYGFDDVTRRSEPAATFGHEAPTARARRSSSPGRRRPPSVPPRRPSAVSRRLSSSPAAASSALVGQHPGLALPVPNAAMSAARGGDVAEWHVSINDVPVGPIRLDEMAHKIDAGAVSEYALVWREGFDEWRPLATVPELMALLHERRFSGPPSRTSFSAMPPFVDSRTSIAQPVRGSARPSRPSAARHLHPEIPVELGALADALQPTTDLGEMSQPPALLGPAGVFQSLPPLGSFSGLPAALEAQVSVPSIPPQAAADSTEPRRGLSLGGLAMIVAVAVFSGVVAFLVFERYGDSLLQDLLGKGAPAAVPSPAPAPLDAPPAEKPQVAAEAEQGAPEEAATEDGEQLVGVDEAEVPPDGEPAASDDAEAVNTVLAVEPPNPSDNAPRMKPAEPPGRKVWAEPRPDSVEGAPKGGALTTADQKLLEDFGSSAHAAPAKIDIDKPGNARSDNPPLDGDAVRATVATNKPRLQRCYERAIRGLPSAPSVRLDVTVTVVASGRVKNVSAEGSAPGGLAECIEASVRRWRFPESSEGGPAKFPIVFSAN